jgi:hypothetical protein
VIAVVMFSLTVHVPAFQISPAVTGRENMTAAFVTTDRSIVWLTAVTPAVPVSLALLEDVVELAVLPEQAVEKVSPAVSVSTNMPVAMLPCLRG